MRRAYIVLCTITLVGAGSRGYHYDLPSEQISPARIDKEVAAHTPPQIDGAPVSSQNTVDLTQQPASKYLPSEDVSYASRQEIKQVESKPSVLYSAPVETQLPAQQYLPTNEQKILPVTSSKSPGYHYSAPKPIQIEATVSGGYHYDGPVHHQQSNTATVAHQQAQKYLPPEEEDTQQLAQKYLPPNEHEVSPAASSNSQGYQYTPPQPEQRYLPAEVSAYHYDAPARNSQSITTTGAHQPDQKYLPAEQAQAQQSVQKYLPPNQQQISPVALSSSQEYNYTPSQPVQRYLPAEAKLSKGYNYDAPGDRQTSNTVSQLTQKYLPPEQAQTPGQKYLPTNEREPLRVDSSNSQGYHYNPPESAKAYLPPEASRAYHYDAPAYKQETNIATTLQQPVQRYLPSEQEETQQPAQKYLPANEQKISSTAFSISKGYHYNPPESAKVYPPPEASRGYHYDAPAYNQETNIATTLQQPVQRYLPSEQEETQQPAQKYLLANEQKISSTAFSISKGYHYNPPEPTQTYLPAMESSEAHSTQEPALKYLPTEQRVSQNIEEVKVEVPHQKYLPALKPLPFNNPMQSVEPPSQSYLPVEKSVGMTNSDSVISSPAPLYLPASDSAKVTVSKHFFIQNSKDYIPESQQRHHHAQHNKHYRLIFIKAPTPQVDNPQALQPQSEEKTLIYVLSQKQENIGYIPDYGTPASKPNQPEVFFVKYGTAEEASRIQQQIQGQYDALSGLPTSYLPSNR